MRKLITIALIAVICSCDAQTKIAASTQYVDAADMRLNKRIDSLVLAFKGIVGTNYQPQIDALLISTRNTTSRLDTLRQTIAIAPNYVIRGTGLVDTLKMNIQ